MKTLSDNQDDAEANYFAMHLLVPTNLLRRAIEELGPVDICDDDTLKKIAKRFGVSQTIIAMRISEEHMMKP